MSQKKTIYLHIGSPKTGTTAIQMFMRKNQELLEKDGVIFPTPFEMDWGFYQNITRLIFDIKGVPGCHETTSYRNHDEMKATWREKYLPIINASSADKILLSAEDLFIFQAELVDVLKEEGFDVKVIAYIRKPAEYLASLYAQWIWEGYIRNNNFKTFVADMIARWSRLHIHYEYLMTYIDKVGKDNIIIRPYEKEQWKNNNLIDDFMSLIGIDNTENYEQVEKENTSLTRNEAETLSLINYMTLDYQTCYEYKARLKESKSFESAPSFEIIKTLSDEEIKYVTDAYMPVINKVCEIVMPGKNLFISNYPSCYGKEKPVFDHVTISKEELSILDEALHCSNNNIRKKEKSLLKKKNNGKTIYLHIGSAKTGTTAIQKFLRQNPELLEKNGVLFPTPYNVERDEFSQNILRLIYDIKGDIGCYETSPFRSYKDRKRIWKKKFMPLIKASSADKIILSAEDLFVSQAEIIDIFTEEGFEVKVIAYIRKPAEYLASLYGQWIKEGFVKSNFTKFIEAPILGMGHYEYLMTYVNKVGKDNIIIRPYEKEQWKNNNLIDDFLSLVGIDYKENSEQIEKENVSLTRNKAEIIRLKNLLNFDFATSFYYCNRLRDAKSCSEDSASKIVNSLSDEEIKYITDKYMPVINKTCEIVMPDKKLFINDYPSCYGMERQVFNHITISEEELTILKEAFKYAKNRMRKKKVSFLQKIFSLRNDGNHKVLTLLGIKMKFRRKKKN